MRVRFLEVAARELDEAVAFYDAEQAGLGTRFAEDVERALAAIVAFPQAWHPMSACVRRCRLRRFPYGVIYQIREDGELLILAVAHLHRRPECWRARMERGA